MVANLLLASAISLNYFNNIFCISMSNFSDNFFILQTEALSNVWPVQGLLKETNNNNWILYLERGQKRNNEWLVKVAKLFIKQQVN